MKHAVDFENKTQTQVAPLVGLVLMGAQIAPEASSFIWSPLFTLKSLGLLYLRLRALVSFIYA